LENSLGFQKNTRHMVVGSYL